MKTLKTTIQTKFDTLSSLTLAFAFSSFLLMLRVKLNKSYDYLFLIWNVFLAIIPYVITLYLNTDKSLKKVKLILGFGYYFYLTHHI